MQRKCSVLQFSSDCLQPHGPQHARLPRSLPTPPACSDSYPSSQWCHPTIKFSVIPFSSCFQSFPVSGTFLMSQFFALGGQSVEALASASVLAVNIQDCFPFFFFFLIFLKFALRLTGLIALWSKGLSRVFSNTTDQRHQFFGTQLYGPTLISIYDYWKNHSFNYTDLCWQSGVCFLVCCLGCS